MTSSEGLSAITEVDEVECQSVDQNAALWMDGLPYMDNLS